VDEEPGRPDGPVLVRLPRHRTGRALVKATALIETETLPRGRPPLLCAKPCDHGHLDDLTPGSRQLHWSDRPTQCNLERCARSAV